MIWLWGIVLHFVILLLLLGYFLDKKTDRYKRINNKSAKDGQESVKDETQKQNPPNYNHTNPW